MQTVLKHLVRKKHWKMTQAQLDAVAFTQGNNTGQGVNDFQTLMNDFSEGIESQQDQNFSMNDNDVHFKKEKKVRNTEYSSTKVKARNLLTNVGYRIFKESDFTNVSFITDILSFVLYNFNPINIERKVDTENEQKMISFLWEVCIPTSLTAYIFQPENYQIIADPKLTYQKANKIVKKWVANANVTDVSNIVASNFKSIHFIHSSLYPKIYSRINSFGIKNKGDFDLAFALYKNNKLQSNFEVYFTGKNPNSYIKREEINENEQKPIEIQNENTEDKKWVFKPTIKPKLPTVRAKARELRLKDYDEKKKILKHKLEENTKHMELMKKVKRSYVKKPIVIN